MAQSSHAQNDTEDLGTVFRVTYEDGVRLVYVEPDYLQELHESQDPARVEVHRIAVVEEFQQARWEISNGEAYLTAFTPDGNQVYLGDAVNPELETLPESSLVNQLESTMAQLDIRDGEGQERQETAEQTQATATDFQDRVEALMHHLESWSREHAQDRSEGIV